MRVHQRRRPAKRRSASLNSSPLASNGGPTQTMALYDPSVAIDQIPVGVNGCGQASASTRGERRALAARRPPAARPVT
ncbi:MAG: choice-of-anchor Q domain-containing protein [Caldilineales bacterium]